MIAFEAGTHRVDADCESGNLSLLVVVKKTIILSTLSCQEQTGKMKPCLIWVKKHCWRWKLAGFSLFSSLTMKSTLSSPPRKVRSCRCLWALGCSSICRCINPFVICRYGSDERLFLCGNGDKQTMLFVLCPCRFAMMVTPWGWHDCLPLVIDNAKLFCQLAAAFMLRVIRSFTWTDKKDKQRDYCYRWGRVYR